MTDMTLREQMYRRWKKGEDYCVLAKEMGVTRERMKLILKKMDAEVPLVDRIEALNEQLDAARMDAEEAEAYADEMEKVAGDHLIAAMDLITSTLAIKAKLAKAVEALERVSNSQPRPKRNGDYDRSDVSALQRIARTTLAELGGAKP